MRKRYTLKQMAKDMLAIWGEVAKTGCDKRETKFVLNLEYKYKYLLNDCPCCEYASIKSRLDDAPSMCFACPLKSFWDVNYKEREHKNVCWCENSSSSVYLNLYYGNKTTEERKLAGKAIVSFVKKKYKNILDK